MPFIENNDQFIGELTKMFQTSRNKGGSVSITMKRWDGHTKPVPRNSDGSAPGHHQEYKCLFRAKWHNKKISTVVNPKDVNKFQLLYAGVIKSNMDNLKKRDRNKGDKEKKSTVTRAAKSDH